MAQQIQLNGPNGSVVFNYYYDHREMIEDYHASILHIGDHVVYRKSVCEILYECTDVDGVKYLELLCKGDIQLL